MAEMILEFDLSNYEFGKVEVPVKDVWTTQTLNLEHGYSRIFPDKLVLWGVNTMLSVATSSDGRTADFSPQAVVQFEDKICVACSNNHNCHRPFSDAMGKVMEIEMGEKPKNFERRARRGLCVNPRKLVVKRSR
jgi:hypothetical protein